MLKNVSHQEQRFLISLYDRFGLSYIELTDDVRFSDDKILDKIAAQDEQMDAFYDHTLLLELSHELLYDTKTFGHCRIVISDKEVTIQKI